MKNQTIKNTIICMLLATLMIACKKETTVTPNVSLDQYLTMQVNGRNWSSNNGTLGTYMADIIDAATITGMSNDTSIMVSLKGADSVASYNVKQRGLFRYLSLQGDYQLKSTSTKGHMVINITNRVDDPKSDLDKITATFSGVIYNIYNSNDSVIITNGQLGFK
jgi:hypothetical protein